MADEDPLAAAQPIYIAQKTREAVIGLTAEGSLRARIFSALPPLITLHAHRIADAALMERLKAIIALLTERALPDDETLRHLTDDEVTRARDDILSLFEASVSYLTSSRHAGTSYKETFR